MAAGFSAPFRRTPAFLFSEITATVSRPVARSWGTGGHRIVPDGRKARAFADRFSNQNITFLGSMP